MLLTFTILGFIGLLLIHELGHAVAMVRCGVEVTEVGLGLPVTREICHVTIAFRGKPVKISLYPVVFGAFVRSSDNEGGRDLEALSYKEKSYIYGAGPLANIYFALIVVWCLVAYKAVSVSWVMLWAIVTSNFMLYIVLGYLVLLLFQKSICMVLVPLASIPFIIWLSFALVAPIESEAIVGPVGIVSLGTEMISDYTSSLYFIAMISFSLGITNLLPLYPLDGGLIVKETVQRLGKRACTTYQIFGKVYLGVMLVIVIGKDIWGLLPS